MRNEMMLLGAILVPLIGAFILPLVGMFSARLRNLLALSLVVSSLVFSLRIAPAILSGGALTVFRQLPLGFNVVFTADNLAVFMALVSSLISSIIIIYSFGYISHYENQDEYYSMVVLFFGSMMGLVFSGNLIFMYMFWEITAITSWRLIGFFREKNHVLKADKAFLVTVFGALTMLIGFIVIYQQTGSFDLAVIKSSLNGSALSNITVMLILFGILSKSATLPFHTWLPDAGVAPSPVTALLHAAILVKIGVYVYARLFIATFSMGQFWHTGVLVIAAASSIVSAGAALIETDLKRIIAYSTVSQIGFIFFGLAVGSETSIAGSLLYIFMHGLAKAGLFLCAGNVEQNTGIKDITKLGGLIRTMPVTAISFLFCSFSVMGIPPFGGFFSKYMVFAGAVNSGQRFIAYIFLFGSFLTILYLFRIFNSIFLGGARCASQKEGSRLMVFSVAILAALSLAAGIFISYSFNFALLTARQMLGMV